MATFFGEILPVVSRAVDEDENSCRIRDIATSWINVPNKFDTFEADLLVVASSNIASGFLNAYCLNDSDSTCIGFISETEKENVTQEGEKIFSFHHRSYDDYVIVYCLPCVSYLEPSNVWLYVNQIFQLPFLSNPERVTILDSFSIYNYLRGDNKIDSPLVKSIWTSTYKKEKLFSTFDQPNFISGLSAGVLSTCEMRGIPCIAHICLTESISSSLLSIDAFRPLLSFPSFRSNKERKEVLKTIKQMISSQESQHSLYV